MRTPTSAIIFATILLMSNIDLVLGQTAASDPRVWGKQAGPWQLAISTQKLEFVVGETVEVAATIKNTSGQRVRFTDYPDPYLYTIDVLRAAPSWIPFAMRPPKPLATLERDASGKGFDVAPSWEYTRKYELNKLFNLLAPGEYHVKFSCVRGAHRIGEKNPSAETSDVTVVSNELVITIISSKK